MMLRTGSWVSITSLVGSMMMIGGGVASTSTEIISILSLPAKSTALTMSIRLPSGTELNVYSKSGSPTASNQVKPSSMDTSTLSRPACWSQAWPLTISMVSLCLLPSIGMLTVSLGRTSSISIRSTTTLDLTSTIFSVDRPR